MIVNTVAHDPYLREKRHRDKDGRYLGSEFICYARINGRSKRLCSWDTMDEALDYLRALVGEEAQTR